MDLKKEKSDNVEVAPDIKGPKLAPTLPGLPSLADQKDTPKGDRLNKGNYDYVNSLNQPVKSLTDKIIELLLLEKVSELLPSIPLKNDKLK